MRLFELESVPRRQPSAEDMVVMIDLLHPELSVAFPVIGPPPEG